MAWTQVFVYQSYCPNDDATLAYGFDWIQIYLKQIERSIQNSNFQLKYL